jgi:long-subunit acyl-CoA synthetase (AMP-forming)
MLESILARLLTDDGSALQVLGRDMDLSYRRLGAGVAQVLRLLERHRGAGGGAGLRVGLFMPDGPEWVCADLALMLGGHRSIPIPLEFSPAQAFALLREADVCLTVPEVVEAPHLARFPSRLRLELRDEWLFAQDNPGLEVGVPTGLDPDATRLVKAIHTSGTTDQPKGVLLSYGAISSKVETLTRLIGVSHLRRYLSLVPLSLLLEQICGIYLTLSCGGTLVLLPPEEGPLTGGGPSVEPYLRRLAEALPTFTVLPPVLVEAMHSFAAERPRMDSR